MPPNPLSRVIVKFVEAVVLPYRDDIEDEIELRGIGQWNALRAAFPGIRIRRAFRRLEETNLNAIVNRGSQRDSTYQPRKLWNFFLVECASTDQAEQVAAVLRSWNSVESAEVDRAVLLTQCSSNYLGPSPAGIDALHAHNVPGGDGTGQSLVDLELGWVLNHAALAPHAIPPPLTGENDPGSAGHGTSALAVACGRDTAQPFHGIAFNVQSVRLISAKPTRGAAAVSVAADGIMDALDKAVFAFGDVLLIEITDGFHPLEFTDLCYQAIRAATATGVVVVEAAGNGAMDLDNQVDVNGDLVFTRAVRDSLAIVVASSTSAMPYAARASSNFGSRIDCFAWGDSIFTATSTNPAVMNSYSPPCFEDTSGAAAIIAGAALSVQGMAQALAGARLAPEQLRDILADATNGTTAAGARGNALGVMPDLQKIASNTFGFGPRTGGAPAPPRNVRIITN